MTDKREREIANAFKGIARILIAFLSSPSKLNKYIKSLWTNTRVRDFQLEQDYKLRCRELILNSSRSVSFSTHS